MLVSERARRLNWAVASNPVERAIELGSAMSVPDREADENVVFTGEMPSTYVYARSVNMGTLTTAYTVTWVLILL
jgi:hypothetical protein